MKKTIYTALITLISFTITVQSQSLTGNLEQHIGQTIKLLGFNNFTPVVLDSTVVDNLGAFKLNYAESYKGMALLQTQDGASLVLLLNKFNIQLTGTHLTEHENLVYRNSNENNLLLRYVKEQAQRENALAAWQHLLPLYKNSETLKSQQQVLKFIKKELKRLKAEDAQFIANLTDDSYLKWFIPIRKLVSEMPATAMRYPERIPENIEQFRSIDFKHNNFKNSGILKDLIEGHYMLLENMGQGLDSVFAEMNLSTDYLVTNLQGNDALLHEVVTTLFSLFEKRSLFGASEYLALKMLTQNSCVLDEKLAKRFEKYRSMKVGSTVKDIVFSENLKLSQLPNKYTLLVFGASWCPKCVEDLPKLANYASKWKNKGVEIVFISLDTDQKQFEAFTKIFPWFSYCDTKSWESKPVQDYYVFATPTMYILDSELKLLVSPLSVEHANSWINYQLK